MTYDLEQDWNFIQDIIRDIIISRSSDKSFLDNVVLYDHDLLSNIEEVYQLFKNRGYEVSVGYIVDDIPVRTLEIVISKT